MFKTAFVVLCLTFTIFSNDVHAEIQERLKEDFFNIYKHIAITARNFTEKHVTPDKIKYYLFTKDNPLNYTEIDPENPKILTEGNGTIVFIIHGWSSSRETQWYEDLKNAFLLRPENYRVLQVDWSEPANQFYTISSWNTKDVGNIIGEFVVGLHQNYSIPLSNFLFLGHSLGGQVCGYIGKTVQNATGEKLPRIIAMDPAGPLFSTRPENERLNKNDAEVVTAIHTDGGTFGFKNPLGTIDFFPNGGNLQPGCTRIDLLDITSVAEPVICDHERSYAYFIEALLNDKEFMALKCDGWAKFKAGLCSKDKVALGDLKTRESGNFYFDTNKEKPYAKKTVGLNVKDAVSLAQTPLKIFN